MISPLDTAHLVSVALCYLSLHNPQGAPHRDAAGVGLLSRTSRQTQQTAQALLAGDELGRRVRMDGDHVRAHA